MLIGRENTFYSKLWHIANAAHTWHFYDYANIVTFDVFIYEKNSAIKFPERKKKKKTETNQSLRQEEWKLLPPALETNAC